MPTSRPSFASLLDALYTDWERAHGKPLRNIDVSGALAAAGCPLSVPYLSQLRSGARQPSTRAVTALALTFGINVDYFYTGIRVHSAESRDDARTGDYHRIEGLSNDALRHLLLAATGLSDVALARLIGSAELLRALENVAPDPEYQEPYLPPPAESWPPTVSRHDPDSGYRLRSRRPRTNPGLSANSGGPVRISRTARPPNPVGEHRFPT
ncbi:hypothetical protein ACW9HQ_40440 [Nocardia gipuzkoensis]